MKVDKSLEHNMQITKVAIQTIFPRFDMEGSCKAKSCSVSSEFHESEDSCMLSGEQDCKCSWSATGSANFVLTLVDRSSVASDSTSMVIRSAPALNADAGSGPDFRS